jgi:uncharacterized phage protein (TIGR02218 family)
MPERLSIYGITSFSNERPVRKSGLYGRVRMGSYIHKGISLYGRVYCFDVTGYPGAELTIAELYTIICQDGSTAYFTSHGENISYGGNVYQAIPLQRGKIGVHSDLQVDKVGIEMGLIGITVGAKDYSVPQLIQRGFLRQARVQILGLDYVTGTPALMRFDGYVTDTIGYNSGVLSLQVGSILDKLNEKFPKLVYSEFCPHRLYGQFCGLAAADWKESSTVNFDGTTTRRIYADVFLFTNQAEGYWVRGEIKVTDESSDEYNISRTILSHGDGYVDLMMPLESILATDTTFDAWPGCDKSGAMCDEKFDNYANFLGFEYIPKPEVMYG